MPVNKTYLRQPLALAIDFVAQQTWDNVHKVDSGFAIDATLGLLVATNATAIAALGIGGFADQSVVAVCGYTATTTVGNEDFGVLLRMKTISSPDATYYYVCVNGQQCQIRRIVDGTFSTRTFAAFALPQDTDVTITCSVVGNVLTANFLAGALDVDLSTSDSVIAGGGLVGIRTLTSTGYFKSVSVEELAA